MFTNPSDPPAGLSNPGVPQYALEGRVVTMDAAYSVLDTGSVYIDGGKIVAVNPTGTPSPA